MLSIGIKELKAKLSSFVEKASHGEKVVITDHGREVALIVPISSERSAVKALIEANKAKWKGGKPIGIKGIHIKGKLLSETILEERH
ncbi:MAG: type II toxin-antitoxin system prevent-host-death family antitoxin [Nitrospirae bacterium]|nr:type II toxin-antitoxin system prevent-host-death family antitoxin [Nitrospirota bacterium]